MKTFSRNFIVIVIIILVTVFIVKKFFPGIETQTDTVTVVDDAEVNRLTTKLKDVTVERDSLRDLEPKEIRIPVPGKDSVYIDTVYVSIIGQDTLYNVVAVDTLTKDGDEVKFTYKSVIITTVAEDSLKEKIFVAYSVTDSLLDFTLKKKPVNLRDRLQLYVGGDLTIRETEKIIGNNIEKSMSLSGSISSSVIIKEQYLIYGRISAIGSTKEYSIGFQYRFY